MKRFESEKYAQNQLDAQGPKKKIFPFPPFLPQNQETGTSSIV
jgi:hypothetical protein